MATGRFNRVLRPTTGSMIVTKKWAGALTRHPADLCQSHQSTIEGPKPLGSARLPKVSKHCFRSIFPGCSCIRDLRESDLKRLREEVRGCAGIKLF
jgi:hypothetical protein